MAELDHEDIRIIAYELWERDGAPEGRDEEYWHAAVKLLSDEAAGDDKIQADGPQLPSLMSPV